MFLTEFDEKAWAEIAADYAPDYDEKKVVSAVIEALTRNQVFA